MGPLERLDKILEEFEDSSQEVGKIKALIQEISNTTQTINKATDLIEMSKDKIAAASDNVELNEKTIRNLIDKEDYRREEFASTVKSTLIKMNNENMDLYQNLSTIVKGSLETNKIELSNIINSFNNDSKKGFEMIDTSVKRLENNLISKIDTIETNTAEIREDFEIKFKYIKTLLFAITGVVSIAVVLAVVLLFKMG